MWTQADTGGGRVTQTPSVCLGGWILWATWRQNSEGSGQCNDPKNPATGISPFSLHEYLLHGRNKLSTRADQLTHYLIVYRNTHNKRVIKQTCKQDSRTILVRLQPRRRFGGAWRCMWAWAVSVFLNACVRVCSHTRGRRSFSHTCWCSSWPHNKSRT